MGLADAKFGKNGKMDSIQFQDLLNQGPQIKGMGPN